MHAMSSSSLSFSPRKPTRLELLLLQYMASLGGTPLEVEGLRSAFISEKHNSAVLLYWVEQDKPVSSSADINQLFLKVLRSYNYDNKDILHFENPNAPIPNQLKYWVDRTAFFAAVDGTVAAEAKASDPFVLLSHWISRRKRSPRRHLRWALKRKRSPRGRLRWILRLRWVFKLPRSPAFQNRKLQTGVKTCKKAMRPVDEEPYEVRLDNHGCHDGPKTGRLSVLNNAPKLFSGLNFYFSGDFVSGDKEDLQNLVITAGGEIVDDKEELVQQSHDQATAPSRTLVVYNLNPPQGCKLGEEVTILRQRLNEAEELAAKIRSQVIGHTWLLESIASYKLQPFVSLH